MSSDYLIGAGLLLGAYFFMQSKRDPPAQQPPNKKDPPELPTLPNVPSPPPVKGFKSGYPSADWPAVPFCAINFGFKTPHGEELPDPNNPNVISTLARGCDPSVTQCTGQISYVPALAGVTQDQCVNYSANWDLTWDTPQQKAVIAARGVTGFQGQLYWRTNLSGFPDPEASELIWYDPLQQTGVFMAGPTPHPQTFDASDWNLVRA